jgi:hypothetical protein
MKIIPTAERKSHATGHIAILLIQACLMIKDNIYNLLTHDEYKWV